MRGVATPGSTHIVAAANNIEAMRNPFSSEPVDPAVAQAQAEARKRRKIVFGVIAAALLVIGYFVLSAFLPRWWGREVGRWCNDTFGKGLLYGLVIGFVCTFVPLVVASTVFFRRLSHQFRVVLLAVAVLIAAPNLLTLSIATGTGSGAHAGDRYMDVRAPFFRGATLIGAIVAAILFLLMIWQARAGQRVRTAKRTAKQNRSSIGGANDTDGTHGSGRTRGRNNTGGFDETTGATDTTPTTGNSPAP